jgi:hypothetical protein
VPIKIRLPSGFGVTTKDLSHDVLPTKLNRPYLTFDVFPSARTTPFVPRAAGEVRLQTDIHMLSFLRCFSSHAGLEVTFLRRRSFV